jgi:hypothetical protein
MILMVRVTSFFFSHTPLQDDSLDDESDRVSPMQTTYFIYTIHAKLTLVFTNDWLFT